jgi:Flp pilus assembly secretin CpaC
VLFPGSRLFLTPLKERLVIKGQAGSREEEAAILQIVKSALSKYFADDLPSTDPTAPAEQNENFIVNLIHVEIVKSVSLKVQAVELDHAKMRNFGFDFKRPARFPGHTPITNLELNTASITGLFEDQEIDAFITALTNAGVAEVVAEPTLVVQSGYQASFLSSGVFPVADTVGDGGPSDPAWYRGAGTSLLVRATAHDKDFIKLEVTPEVSTQNSDRAGQETSELNVRRSTQIVRMREGHSFALTTEVERAVHDDAAQIPFLGELPVIGSAFRAKPVMTTRKMLLVITPTIGVAEISESLPPAPQPIAEGALPQSSHQLVKHTAEANPDYQLSENLNQTSDRQPQTAWSKLPAPTPLPPSPAYPVPQTTSWNPQPAWRQALISRLSHLQNAVASLMAAGLTVQADEVRQEIRKQKLAEQRRTLQRKKRELAALQAEVETLRNSLSLTSNGLVTHIRLNSLILTSTNEELRRSGLDLDNAVGTGALVSRIVGDTADALLEKCKQTAGIKVLGSSTQLVANGERTTWQNGVEVAVPEVVQTEGSSEQKLSTEFRLVGSDIALTPKLRDDGTISLEAVLEFSKTGNEKRGVVQVSGRSVPQIDSRRIRSEMKLTSGQTVLFGMPHMPQDGDEVVVIAITVSTKE